ncbi:MAG: LytTR family DNA-binding domain-containing protein [Bacteroidales bacterium]
MNAIIVDDEHAVRNSIQTLLGQEFPAIKVVATASTVAEAKEALTIHQPDLLFLDVELPDGTGFDLLTNFRPAAFRVIFITGHREYALNAIKVSALDYILKPFEPEELISAVKKAMKSVSSEEEKQKFEAFAENLNPGKVLKRIILHTADHLHVVEIKDIIRAEADSNYTIFWLSGERKIMVSRTIKEFDELLSGSGLLRVHQSHLVNLYFVDRFVKRDGGYLLLKDSTPIPVSQNLKKKVIGAINNFIYE